MMPNTENQTMSNDEKYGLSRRKALLGLGTIGAAGAGAGFGTSALFSDTETFTNNRIVAGELDLIVDYGTSVDDPTNASTTDVIDGGQANNGDIQGDVSAEYVLNDVKPGDGGFLAFCPKVVDNPAWLWAGSSGLTDFENGYTEPERSADPDADSSTALTDDDPGAGEGELSENIQVTVEYCSYDGSGDRGDPENYTTIRELNNPDDYTLADLILDLQTGFLLDGDTDTSGTQAYPASDTSSDQVGPCLCVKWDIPADVGNEIQSDSVEFDIQFAAEQERNNPDPENPFVDATYSTTQGWGDTFDSATINPLSSFGANNPEENLNISYGSQQVVFEVELADSFDTGSTDNDVFNLVFDSDDDGAIDFEVAWAADPSNTAPSGENFWYKSGGNAQSLSNFSDITANIDTNDNIVTITVGRSRLNSTYKVAWQALYRGGSSSFDATKIPFTQPRWKFSTGSTNFATETLPSP